MPIREWDKNEEGNIWITPLLRFDLAHLHETGVGLRLEVSTDKEQPQRVGRIAQVAMTVEQAEELIAGLRLTVDYILTRRAPEGHAN